MITVPAIIIITQIFKLFPIPRQYLPTIAGVLGFLISVFISHRHNLWAGLFMGAFYGAAAVGTYSSLKTSWIACEEKRLKKPSKISTNPYSTGRSNIF